MFCISKRCRHRLMQPYTSFHLGHARIQGFCQGVQAKLPENSSDNVSFFVCLSPKLILQFFRGCPMVIPKKTIIFQGFRGGPSFYGGPTFSGGVGVQMLISVEIHMYCDFPGGGGVGPPIPPSRSAQVGLYCLPNNAFRRVKGTLPCPFKFGYFLKHLFKQP